MNNNNNNDDIFNEIFNSIFKSSTGEEKKENASDTSELDMVAVEVKKFYDSFVKAGFTETQAMNLLVSLIVAGLKK